MDSKFYAQGTMKTADGVIKGTVIYNPYWKKWQSSIDGELSGEFKTKEEAVADLDNAGVKNIKINKNYVAEHRTRPTKRQIAIAEHFVKQTAKNLLKEADYNPNSSTYKKFNLQAFADSFAEYVRKSDFNPDQAINFLQKAIDNIKKEHI